MSLYSVQTTLHGEPEEWKTEPPVSGRCNANNNTTVSNKLEATEQCLAVKRMVQRFSALSSEATMDQGDSFCRLLGREVLTQSSTVLLTEMCSLFLQRWVLAAILCPLFSKKSCSIASSLLLQDESVFLFCSLVLALPSLNSGPV